MNSVFYFRQTLTFPLLQNKLNLEPSQTITVLQRVSSSSSYLLLPFHSKGAPYFNQSGFKSLQSPSSASEMKTLLDCKRITQFSTFRISSIWLCCTLKSSYLLRSVISFPSLWLFGWHLILENRLRHAKQCHVWYNRFQFLQCLFHSFN